MTTSLQHASPYLKDNMRFQLLNFAHFAALIVLMAMCGCNPADQLDKELPANRVAQLSVNSPAHTTPLTSPFRLIAYLSGGRFPNEQEALNSHIDHVTDINFAFINPANAATGTIAPLSEKKDRSLRNLVALAKQHDKRVFLAFGGWRGNDPGYDEVYEQIATSEITRARFIQEIVRVVDDYNADGVDMDWEYPRLDTPQRAYAQEYALFIHELAAALHAKDKRLSAAVIGVKDKSTDDGDGAAYLDSVLEDLDLVNLMAYDASDNDHSPYELAEASLNYWIDQRGLDPQKAVLGLPIYARPGWIDYHKIVDQFGDQQAQLNHYQDDEGDDKGFYNGIPLVSRKTKLAIDRGLAGVVFWELPLDTYGKKTHLSLIKTAHDVIRQHETENSASPSF